MFCQLLNLKCQPPNLKRPPLMSKGVANPRSAMHRDGDAGSQSESGHNGMEQPHPVLRQQGPQHPAARCASTRGLHPQAGWAQIRGTHRQTRSTSTAWQGSLCLSHGLLPSFSCPVFVPAGVWCMSCQPSSSYPVLRMGCQSSRWLATRAPSSCKRED